MRLRYQLCTRGNKEELLTALQLDGAETINTQSKLQQRVKSIVVRLKGNRGRQINRLALIRFAVEVGIAEVFVRSASANPCTIRRPTLLTEDKVILISSEQCLGSAKLVWVMSEARPQTLTGLIDRDYSRRPIDAIHYLLPPPSTNCCQQVSFKLHSRSILVDLSTSHTRDSPSSRATHILFL